MYLAPIRSPYEGMYLAPIRAPFLFFGLRGVQISKNKRGIRKMESSVRIRNAAFLCF